MATIIEPNQILTVPDVARLLGVSERTVRRMVQRGELPDNRKVGEKRRFTGQQILSSLATPATMRPDNKA